MGLIVLLRCDKIRDDVYLNQRRQGCSSVLVSPSLIAPTIRSKLGPESRSGVQISVRSSAADDPSVSQSVLTIMDKAPIWAFSVIVKTDRENDGLSAALSLH